MPSGCRFLRRVCVYWDNTGYVSAKPNPKTCVSDLSLRSTFAIFVSVSTDLTYAIPHKDSRMGTIVPPLPPDNSLPAPPVAAEPPTGVPY